MHVSFALFADAANLSQEGKLNILGVFDAVHVGSLPAVHPRATLVVRLKGFAADVGNHALTLRWLNPRSSELWSSTVDLAVNAPPGHAAEMDMPVIASIDLPLDSIGNYSMIIDLDGKVHAETRLHVRAGAPIVAPSPGAMVS
ncbi:MAG: hypothetical protein M3Y64_03700 [Gemmatimonadota bacterium]|nr:hypothetical protein [Gemmatimonadota bacterium]